MSIIIIKLSDEIMVDSTYKLILIACQINKKLLLKIQAISRK